MQLEQILIYVCWALGFRKPFQLSESPKNHFYRSYDHKLTFTHITWGTVAPPNDQIQNFDVVFRYQQTMRPLYRHVFILVSGSL